MDKLVARQRLVMTFIFFSMFFGAGNLIFPPFVGAQAGSATIPAAIGFIVSAVGLPILGVLAVTFAGGFDKLASRVSPQIRLVPRRGDHAHHRPVLCDSAYGDHLIRNDGGSFRTVLLWLAGRGAGYAAFAAIPAWLGHAGHPRRRHWYRRCSAAVGSRSVPESGGRSVMAAAAVSLL